MDIQGYWCIFNHIHRHPTRREGEVSPALIWKSRKCPGFGKKGPDCVNLWVTFSIQNANLRVFGWKNSKMFPCLQGLFSFSFFFFFLTKCLLKCSSSTKPPQRWKNFDCPPALRYYSFCKALHLKCLTLFWICLCLDNDSVIFTVTLCFVLHQNVPHQTYLEFWLIQNSIYLGICRIIQSYSTLLKHIHAYWSIFEAYTCIFSTLCSPHISKSLPNSGPWYI